MTLAQGASIGGGWTLASTPEEISASNQDLWEQPLANTTACAKLRALAVKTGVAVGDAEMYRPPIGWSAADVTRTGTGGYEEVGVAWIDRSGAMYIPSVCSGFGPALATPIGGGSWAWLFGIAAAGLGLYYLAGGKKKGSKKS